MGDDRFGIPNGWGIVVGFQLPVKRFEASRSHSTSMVSSIHYVTLQLVQLLCPFSTAYLMSDKP